ncbi:hypothetical protein D3C81_1142670 [compost metagenome]
MLGNLRTDIALAGKYQANRLNHFRQTRALGQITGSAGLQQACRKRILLTHRDRDHLDIRMTAQQFARGFQAADARHLDVHQHHIGLQLSGLDQGLFPGFGLANHLQAIDIGQHTCNACTNEIMVIDH